MKKPYIPALLLVLTACNNQPADETALYSVLASPECLRECLETTIENYLQALAAQDPSRIEVTDNVVFAENNQRLELGDGSWRTFTGSGTYRHYFADPQTQQVAVISTMRENGEGVIYDLRLQLQDGKINEIESMVIRSAAGATLYEELWEEHGGPPPNFQNIIPVEERNSREELLELPWKYLNGMENNDPNGDYSFFADDCNRYEHALKTTNNRPMAVGHTESTTFSTMTCKAQFSGGGLAFVTRIRDERYDTKMVVDEEKQAVFGFVFLDHNGTVRSIARADGSESLIPPYFSTPRSLKVGEAWRVRDRQLFEIEMTLTEIPYGTRPQHGIETEDSSWLQTVNLNSAGLKLPSPCDQLCLETLGADFMNALHTKDNTTLPLSADVSYRENGIALAVGDGLWGTVSEPGNYSVILSNAVNGEVGIFATIVETDIPGLLSARLKVQDGLVTEIDATVMRQEFTGSRGGTLSLFYPQIAGMFTPDNFAMMDAEPEIGNEASVDDMLAAVAAQQSDIREQRILVADPAHGLVLANSIRDVVNAGSTDGFSSGSYSVLTTTLYRFKDEKLVLQKAVSRPVPYKQPL